MQSGLAECVSCAYVKVFYVGTDLTVADVNMWSVRQRRVIYNAMCWSEGRCVGVNRVQIKEMERTI